MELGSWRDCPSLCGSARLDPPPKPSQERGAQGPLPNILRSVPRHGQWPRPTHWSLAIVTVPCLVPPKPEGQRVGGDGHDQRGHRQAPCCSYTLQCLSVCLSDFFTFARAFWAWISSHAFVLPAKLDSRPQSAHALRHMPIWAVATLPSQAEGNKGPWARQNPRV